jgi:hypothetical protein
MNECGWDKSINSSSRNMPVSAKDNDRLALMKAIAATLSARKVDAIPERDADYEKWAVVDEESLDETSSFCELTVRDSFLSTLIDAG